MKKEYRTILPDWTRREKPSLTATRSRLQSRFLKQQTNATLVAIFRIIRSITLHVVVNISSNYYEDFYATLTIKILMTLINERKE